MSEITQIVQCFLPNLVAGKYRVDVTQDVKHGADSIQKVQQKMYFGVDAARFTLNADDIYSVYPPANTTGQYNNQLPHIVFNRRTLPWERTIDGKIPNIDLPIPWMALLLLNEDDMKSLKIEQTKLADVLDSGQSDPITRPQIGGFESPLDLKLMEWEVLDQKCLTIDLSQEQYLKYLPNKKDLTYLAHSKIVTIDHKDPNGIGDVVDSKGYFSVIVGTRIVQKNQTYTAVVVSLEGHEGYLDKRQNTEGSIRMVVLANWSFICEGTETFETLLKKIQVKSLTLQSSLPSGHVLEKYINNGYVPMRHQMRNGAKNISWYRGAFVPNKGDLASTNFIKFSCSDTALYYDEGTGFLDISISAAWELGKIMALNNQEFTKAMVAWNNDPVKSSGEIAPQTIKKAQLIQWLNDKKIDDSLSNNRDLTQSYKPFPDVVKTYLNSIARLEGVQLSYIIPNLKLICTDQGNPDTLTLFYIDPRWIFALLDGAVSLSRELRTDTKTQVEDIMKEIYGTDVVTGFLLHSKLVSGWRGVEIKALGENNELLTTKLRFERITPNIFLGIFQGKINEIIVTQPYEGLHFGLKESGLDGNTYIKNVKSADGSKSGEVTIEKKTSDNADRYILKEKEVIFVENMVSELKKQTSATEFTSAEYAYQMIDSPIKASFQIKYKTK
jgi:hypothetical protein